MRNATQVTCRGFLVKCGHSTYARSRLRKPMPIPQANEFPIPGTRTVLCDGFKIELDLSKQVLAMHAPVETVDPFFSLLRGDPASTETPLSPRLNLTLVDSTTPMSAAVLAQKAKLFDDGLYAAVDLALQQGAGRQTGKVAILASLGHMLAGAEPFVAGTAQELLLGAAHLGHVPIPGIPPAVEARVQCAVERFLGNELQAKPVGFYTWSEELQQLFQQDRMLQQELHVTQDATTIQTIAGLLRADPSAQAAYERYLGLVSRLTNPFATPDFRSVLSTTEPHQTSAHEQTIRFFPPSVAHETTLMRKLFGTAPIPEGFVLMDELINRIRTRALDLAPGPDSGWYDYQTWALEALVIPDLLPEGPRLELDEGYQQLVAELFKGLLTLSRETHIKQLESARFGASRHPEDSIWIHPVLSAEPLVTYYLRRALGYRYVRAVLDEGFGPGEWERLHRLTAAGPVGMCLDEELAKMEQLFLGAHVSTSRELGLLPNLLTGSEAEANNAADQFAAWTLNAASDPDLSADLRTMVPVFYDVERRQTKVWLFLGWACRPVTVSFAHPPEATVRDLRGQVVGEHPRIRWGGLRAELPYPVTAELYVDRILDREEFRKLCDSCGTRAELLRRLGKGTSST